MPLQALRMQWVIVFLFSFTGQVATRGIGKDAFQEADVLGMTMPITKYNYQIRDTADIPRVITEALHIATTGRPGPVVIDVPKDIQERVVDFIMTQLYTYQVISQRLNQMVCRLRKF